MAQGISAFYTRAVWLAAFFVIGSMAEAQQASWVQIEARASLPQAQERAQVYQQRLDNVVGYRLRSGWYAIALGPFTPEAAQQALGRLRGARLVPGDSFIADGRAFRQQFWPPGASGPVEPIAVAPGTLDPGAVVRSGNAGDQPVVEPAPAGETMAEARAAERRLSRAEREDIQRALEWDGFYAARIDGSFGRGTRRAIEAWQLSKSYPATGVLLTVQRNELISEFRKAVASLGLRPIRDEAAGIEVTMPAALVDREREDAPFVHYGPRDGSGVRILLVSQPGDQATLAALYDVMQTLEIVPLEGPRELGRRAFTLVGENADFISYSFAETAGDTVKGFTLIWPAGDEKRRLKVIDEMRASFSPISGQVLPDQTASLDGAARRELLAGLDVRQPDASLSGFFVDRGGRVLTASGPIGTCTRITLGDDTDMTVVASNAGLGLALLEPTKSLVPIRFAAFDELNPGLGTEIAVSGFSFGGVLGTPTVTFGRVEDTRSLDGRPEVTRLALLAEDGDVGGPVLDAGGSVRGMLLPQPDKGTKQLPAEVRYAADADAIATFLIENGVEPGASRPVDPLAPVDLAERAADMTVLIRCWN